MIGALLGAALTLGVFPEAGHRQGNQRQSAGGYAKLVSEVGFVHRPREAVRARGQYQGAENKECAYGADDKCWLRKARLSVGSPGRELSGSKVIALTLLGFLLAAPGACLLFWIIDKPNVKRAAIGCAGILASFSATVTCYGWAGMGYPGWVWGW